MMKNSPFHGCAESASQMHRFINFKKSKNNFFVDVNGNTLLDLNAAAHGQVVGYNHDDLINARQTELFDRFVTHKADLNSLPPTDLADLIREQVMPTAPQHMTQVHLGGGSSAAEANELAMTVALSHFCKKHNKDMSEVFVLGTTHSHHGNTTATLSVSDSSANPHKLPAFPWPKIPFPSLQYPYA